MLDGTPSSVAGTIRVILADDHPLVLNGLYHLLAEYPDFEVLDRCLSGGEALASAKRHRPDVLVLDLLTTTALAQYIQG